MANPMGIDFGNARNYASQLTTRAQNMQTILNDTTSIVRRISASYRGRGQVAFEGQFSRLQPRFESFHEHIRNNARFLNRVADLYEQSESDVARLAEMHLNT